MTHWIQIGSELNNSFSFKLLNDFNNKLKIKFIDSYFESSYKLLNYTIFVTIFANILFLVAYLIIPKVLLSLFITIVCINIVLCIIICTKIYKLKDLHKNIFNNKMLFLSVIKQNTTEGIECVFKIPVKSSQDLLEF